MLKERMTPEELAHLTGYSRQTINKWVRKEGWQTSPRPGVQGGKARVVHVSEQVREFIRSAQRAAASAPGTAHVVAEDSFDALLLSLPKTMSDYEQKQLTTLLLREGITGLLLRLGIRTQE
ncbi:MAG TPA: YfeC-like transcriptional regulator [Scandinavium sp.]|jgi:predicted DNA-binding transcriptional regulator AlpA|uniref:YfeC-like transcriptional regulator n=1 Tax=Scandinavium sp. TaxID=2830653 RepID=UPI002E341420|nr:YfeC-like transcriptional regulator [Scandinavium sp.]HEX4503968.1 YfeC-like transcriptional regulator [Scandinavium sp.]